MSVGGRMQTRGRMLRRAGLIAAVLLLVALLFLASGHWVLGIVVGLVGVAAAWLFLQMRAVR